MSTQTGPLQLSVLMPAYNEGPKLKANVEEVLGVLKRAGLTHEIVVIDDGSGDGTWKLISDLAQNYAQVVAVQLKENLGKGQALKKGFAVSRGEHVAFLDADLDVSADQLLMLVDLMKGSGCDIVISSKRHPQSILNYPFHRRVMSFVYFSLVKGLFGLPIRDTQTGLKLFKRAVLERVFPKVLIKKFAYDLELLVIAHHLGFTIQEAPIRIDFRRRFGRIGMGSVFNIWWDTMAVFYRLRVLRYYDHQEWNPWPRDQTPEISILIPTRAHDSYLDECLHHCLLLDYPKFEVIVLPDGEIPLEKITRDDRIKVIPTGPERPGVKRDIGFKSAQGELIAFLDSDAYPSFEWLTMAARHFQDDRVAAVGGPGVTPDSDNFLQRASGHVYASWLGSGPASVRYCQGILQEVDDHPSCNLIVRRKDLEKIGGFKTEYWPGEDTVLCREITHTLGKRIIYDPRALVFHPRRSLFLEHFLQVKGYALRRGFFARRFPGNSRRTRYFVPSLFVLFGIGSLALSLVIPVFLWFWFAVMAIYFLATLFYCFTVRHVWMSPTIWLGLILTHLTYGTYFFKGFMTRKLAH